VRRNFYLGLTTRKAYDTRETDTLGRNWYNFLTAGHNSYFPDYPVYTLPVPSFDCNSRFHSKKNLYKSLLFPWHTFTPCPLALSLNLTYTLLIFLPLFWVIPNYRGSLTSHVPNVMPILCCIDSYKRPVRGRGFLKKFETCSFDSDKLLACRPTPRMEEHHLFALRGYLFNVFLFTLHYMKDLSFTCKQRTRLPFVTRAQITAIITSTIKIKQKH